MGKWGRWVRMTTLPPSSAVVMKSGKLNFLERDCFTLLRYKRRLSLRSNSQGISTLLIPADSTRRTVVELQKQIIVVYKIDQLLAVLLTP